MQHPPKGDALCFVFSHVANVLAVCRNGFQGKQIRNTHDDLKRRCHKQHQPDNRMGNGKPCSCQHHGRKRVRQYAAEIIQHKGIGFAQLGLRNHQTLAARAGQVIKPKAKAPVFAVNHQAPGAVRHKAVARQKSAHQMPCFMKPNGNQRTGMQPNQQSDISQQ